MIKPDTAEPGNPSEPDLVSSSDSGVDNDDITNDNTPTFVGTAEAGTTATLFVNGTALVNTTVLGNGSYVFADTDLSSYGDAVLELTVQVMDAVHKSAFSVPLIITIGKAQ